MAVVVVDVVDLVVVVVVVVVVVGVVVGVVLVVGVLLVVVVFGGVGVVLDEANGGGLGNKEFDFITVGVSGADADAETSRTPPQVRTHSSPDKKLFPFPPQPVYRNFRQLFEWGSW